MKESVQVRNELDSLVYQCEKQVSDLGDKAPDDLKNKIDGMLSDAKVLDDQSSSPAVLKEAKQKLEKGFEEIAKQAHKQELDPLTLQLKLRHNPAIAKNQRRTTLLTLISK